MPGTINSDELALPLGPRQLPARPLITSLQFSEEIQVQKLSEVAGLCGKPDHTNILLHAQSQACLCIVRRTVVQDQKYMTCRMGHNIPEVLRIWGESFANIEVHGIALLVPFRRLVESKIT
jgi:hypothetical protein